MRDYAAEAREAAEGLGGGGPEPAATPLLSTADIFAPLQPPVWLCQELDVAPGAPLLIAGYGFSGKTVAAQDLALAVASGTPAWGRFQVRQGRVLHLDYEQGAYLTRMRYQRLARARDLDPRALAGRLSLAVLPKFYLDGDVEKLPLPRLVEGYDLVVLDSYRAACGSTDENASTARLPLDRLTRISDATGATFAVIHHARKPARDDKGGARMALRGSSGIYDAAGSVLVFSAEKGEPIAVSHEKARISGVTRPDFKLHITDVDMDGDPKAGLRVERLEAPPAANSKAILKREIIDVVSAEGKVDGINAIKQRVRGRKADVSAAIWELVREGRLQNVGTSSRPVFLQNVGTSSRPVFSVAGTDGD